MYCLVGRFSFLEGNCIDDFVLPMSLIACLLPNIVMNFNCNCLVLQSGERREATIGWDTISGTEVVEGLSFYEMELAANTENMLLVLDVGSCWVHRSGHRRDCHNAEKVCRETSKSSRRMIRRRK